MFLYSYHIYIYKMIEAWKLSSIMSSIVIVIIELLNSFIKISLSIRNLETFLIISKYPLSSSIRQLILHIAWNIQPRRYAYKTRLQNLAEFQKSIRQAVDEITPDMLNHMFENMKRRVTLCRWRSLILNSIYSHNNY